MYLTVIVIKTINLFRENLLRMVGRLYNIFCVTKLNSILYSIYRDKCSLIRMFIFLFGYIFKQQNTSVHFPNKNKQSKPFGSQNIVR